MTALSFTVFMSAAEAVDYKGFDPRCVGEVDFDAVDTAANGDFMAATGGLNSSRSTMAPPIPYPRPVIELGVRANMMPPVSCQHRTVFFDGGPKTEDVNPTPVMPSLDLMVAWPIGDWAVTAGGGAFPVGVGIPRIGRPGFRTYMGLNSAEIGVGREVSDNGLQLGLRASMTTMKVVGDVAGRFEQDGGDYDDFLQSSNRGVDLVIGKDLCNTCNKGLLLFGSAGWTDNSSFLWIGDDGFVVVPTIPYSGPAFSAGASWVTNRTRSTVSLYAAPFSLMGDPGDLKRSDYGRLYTARFHFAFHSPSTRSR